MPQQQEEPIKLEKSIESTIQSQNDYIQSQNDSFNRLEAQMSHLVNIINDTNEETLPTQFLTIPDSPSILIGTKNHGALKTLTKIQFSHTNLNLTNLKSLTNW